MDATHQDHLERFLALSARHLGLGSVPRRAPDASPARLPQAGVRSDESRPLDRRRPREERV